MLKQKLEPYDKKLSRTVLRGGKESNFFLLLDCDMRSFLYCCLGIFIAGAYPIQAQLSSEEKTITAKSEKEEQLGQPKEVAGMITQAQQQALEYRKGGTSRSQGQIDEKTVTLLTKKADKQAQELEIKTIVKTSEEQAAGCSDDASKLVKDVDARMQTIQFKGNTQGKLADNKSINIDRMLGRYWSRYQQGKEDKIPELMVFISLSMPERSLKQLGEQTIRAGGVLVIRGMIENSLPKTIAKIHALNEKGLPVIINPILFRKFQVKSVPSIVMVDKKNAFCLTPKSNCTPVGDRIAGNVTLDHALGLFAASGDYQEKAKEYLAKFRGEQ